MNTSDLIMIEGHNILIRDLPDMESSGKLLTSLVKRMYTLRNHLEENKYKYPDHIDCINLLCKNFNEKRTLIYENHPDSDYTSYSVNKAEEFVFCLKCKKTKNLHNINLLYYVAVHEMAHAGCYEMGHTPLFNKIFKFYLNVAIDLGLYCYNDYESYPIKYCGMDLHSNILNPYKIKLDHICNDKNKCKCYNLD